MLSMLCLVVVFGVHSLVDWTWYVPGDACVALLCAGWLAGRGPLDAYAASREVTRDRRPRRAASSRAAAGGGHGRGRGRTGAGRTLSAPVRVPRSLRELGPMRVGVAAAAMIAALLAAWAQWQPQRSEDASQEALALLATNPHAALAAAQTAVARDPLSAQALFALADGPAGRGRAGARAGDARAGRAPAALEPGDVAGARPLRPRTATRRPRCRSCRRRST